MLVRPNVTKTVTKTTASSLSGQPATSTEFETVIQTATSTQLKTVTQTATSTTPTTINVVDMSGATVAVPTTLNKIVVLCQGGAVQEIAAMGFASKIVAMPSQAQFPALLSIYPYLANVPTVGDFQNVNFEALLALNPDLVIAGAPYVSGYQDITNAGVPMISILIGTSNIAGEEVEFNMDGQVYNQTSVSMALINFWNQQLQLISSRVQTLSEQDMKKVYYAHGSLLNTSGSADWAQVLITTAGGINVSADLGSATATNLEQLISWNPDVMILTSNSGSLMPVSSILNDNQLVDINAVINSQVYECPIGTFWWDRPAPEAILGITWLAQTLYPSLFQDVNLESLAQTFYQEFYNYNLTSAEFQSFLSPTATSSTTTSTSTSASTSKGTTTTSSTTTTQTSA